MESREKSVSALPEEALGFLLPKPSGGRVQELKMRSGRCVCRYCGGALGLRRITYSVYDEAKIELYCSSCDRIEYGTEPLIYKMAEYYQDELAFDYYPELDDSADKRRMNIAAISDIMNWGFKNAGLLDEAGFTVPIIVNPELVGEATIITEEELCREGERYDR